MEYLIEDLRFFIGAFSMIVGFLLVVQGLVSWSEINLITGVVFMVLAAGPLYFAVRAAKLKKV